jgi:hypothetical protein
MAESHARSRHEDKADVTEQELFAAANRMIHDYLTGRLPRADAGHLIDELERLLERRYPNPDRINCLDMKTMTQLTSGGHISESDLMHVNKCAPCFRECADLLNRKMS